jgi:Predicted methyltransferase
MRQSLMCACLLALSPLAAQAQSHDHAAHDHASRDHAAHGHAGHDASHVALHAAVDGSWRSEDARARDQYRHPAQTLAFFGVKPTHTVVEITPGGGWYADILAPYLREERQLHRRGGRSHVRGRRPRP